MKTIKYLLLFNLMGVSSLANPPAAGPVPSEVVQPTVPNETKSEPLKAESLPKKPLYFDVKDAELKIKPAVFQFDLEQSAGKKLQMGDVTFDENSLKASVHADAFKLEWNAKLIDGGELSLIDRRGTELWTGKVVGEGGWEYKYRQGENKMTFKPGEQLRFCLRDKNDLEYVNLCSRWYGAEMRDGQLYLGPIVGSSSPRVIFQQEESKLKGRKEVDTTMPVSFFATLATGDSYEFRSSVQALEILDMALSEDPKEVALIGSLPKPINIESKLVKGEDYSAIVMATGFQKTIDERPDTWSGKLKLDRTQIQLPGTKGGIFIFDLEIKNPPLEKYRRYRAVRDARGIYGDKEKITVFDSEDKAIEWEYQTPKKFEMNRVHLDVAGEKATHRSYLDVYRGSSGEASFRMTGIGTASGQFSLFAEGHVSWWLNDLFKSPSYYLSRQRWGTSARYFTSLMPLKEVKSSNNTLTVIQADVRYRLTPGMWERDETVGLIGSYESVKIAKFDVPKMGAGVFWARSMPKVFDQWFSKLPFMNHPKWVDMEFINYFSSLNENKIDADYVINFHGKVLWTPKIFGEAGFGVKNYNVQNTKTDSKLKLTTFYGTVGLGVNF